MKRSLVSSRATLVVLAALIAATVAARSARATPPCQSPAAGKIKHVFVIFKENHTFDNYFGAYGHGSDGAVVASDSHGRKRRLEKLAITDPGGTRDNSWTAAHEDLGPHRLMNHFDKGEGRDEGPRSPFVMYEPRYYWHLAERAVLCDRYFCSSMTSSTPNHMYVIAATSGGWIGESNAQGDREIILPDGRRSTHKGTFTATEIPETIFNALERKNHTWMIYREPSADTRTDGGIDQFQAMTERLAFAQLPEAERKQAREKLVYDESEHLDEHHFLRKRFDEGRLGDVTYIGGNNDHGEHPGSHGDKVKAGEEWTRRILSEIGHSGAWKDCAVFITWDDFGGFYDHVAPPPSLDQVDVGFRVPCLIVSPYARKGHVDHTTLEHASIVKFIEGVFSLGPLPAGVIDGEVNTPRDSSPELNDPAESAFDFDQVPRPFSDFEVD